MKKPRESPNTVGSIRRTPGREVSMTFKAARMITETRDRNLKPETGNQKPDGQRSVIKGTTHGRWAKRRRTCTMKTASLAVVLSLVAASLSAAIAISTISPAGGLTRGGEIVHLHGSGVTG